MWFVQLLQLRLFCLGFLQDSDVWVGIFPESEEVLEGLAGSREVTAQGQSPFSKECPQRRRASSTFRSVLPTSCFIRKTLKWSVRAMQKSASKFLTSRRVVGSCLAPVFLCYFSASCSCDVNRCTILQRFGFSGEYRRVTKAPCLSSPINVPHPPRSLLVTSQ
jgi:hypothetical protein